MDSLRIDGEVLDDLVRRLTTTSAALDSETMFTASVGDLVGDPPLQAVIVTFANAWNVRRKNLVEDLKWLSDSVGKIDQSFGNIETELTKAVEPGTAPQSSGSRRSRS
jgi:hypothetical protein